MCDALISFLFGVLTGTAMLFAYRIYGPHRRWPKRKPIRLCRICGFARESITHSGFRNEPPDHEFC